MLNIGTENRTDYRRDSAHLTISERINSMKKVRDYGRESPKPASPAGICCRKCLNFKNSEVKIGSLYVVEILCVRRISVKSVTRWQTPTRVVEASEGGDQLLEMEQEVRKWWDDKHLRSFSTDATRFSLADAGDRIDDANFVFETANAAILRLTIERLWMEEVIGAESSLRVGPASTYADHVFANEMNFAIKMTERNYGDYMFREALKSGIWDQDSEEYGTCWLAKCIPHRCEHGLYVAIYVGVFPLSTRALLERQSWAPHILTWYQSRRFAPPWPSTSLFRLIEPPALRGSVSVSHIGANTLRIEFKVGEQVEVNGGGGYLCFPYTGFVEWEVQLQGRVECTAAILEDFSQFYFGKVTATGRHSEASSLVDERLYFASTNGCMSALSLKAAPFSVLWVQDVGKKFFKISINGDLRCSEMEADKTAKMVPVVYQKLRLWSKKIFISTIDGLNSCNFGPIG
ncbi:hypothetical protein LXL04_003357 [Taraxacum kok-saghyz]